MGLKIYKLKKSGLGKMLKEYMYREVSGPEREEIRVPPISGSFP